MIRSVLLIEPANCISVDRMLDLNHVCSPVGQHRRGAGDENPLCYFNDAYAGERLRWIGRRRVGNGDAVGIGHGIARQRIGNHDCHWLAGPMTRP